MTADDLRKVSHDAQPIPSDTRLAKDIEWLQRDCMAAAKNAKYFLKVNYSDRPLKDEYILQIQDKFIADGFNVIPNNDLNRFREFIIDWTPVEDSKPPEDKVDG